MKNAQRGHGDAGTRRRAPFLLFVLAFLFNYTSHLSAIPPPPTEADYISFLQKFPLYAEQQWHSGYKGNPQLGYFGTGAYDHNQMRSLSNFIFIYALLATEKDYDPAVSGIQQDTLLNSTRAALRYFTATHVTGNMECVYGSKWGKPPEQWLAPWVISKAVAGAHLIWDKLSLEEKYAIRRVVVYEANYQLKNRAYSREYTDTHAEVNALSAEVLAWAFSLYPTHPNARRWLSKAQELFMNTFSVRVDENDTTIVDGKPVEQWVYTTNVHPDFTLEGHGAYSFDYTAAPLHSLAWAYYAFVSNGQPVPQSLFHHVLDVWETLKKTHLYSGRFACLQGKDWARHVYGPYFIIPALVLLENEFGDVDARLIEQLRFGAFQYEQQNSFRGSIFGARFGYRIRGWSVIYETDCYANIGLAYLLHRFAPLIQAESMDMFQKKVEGSFHSRYCDFLYARSENLFASFSWRSLSRRYPMALFVPGDDYMVEWAEGNLIGHIAVAGFDMTRVYAFHNEQLLSDSFLAVGDPTEDGFVTTGCIREGMRNNMYGIDHYISFTALPKDGVAVMIECLVARERILVTDQAGLSYYLPNDVFNDRIRQIYWENDEVQLQGFGNREVKIPVDSKWINVDDKLGIVGVLDNGQFEITTGRGRNTWDGQVSELICYTPTPPLSSQSATRHWYEKGDIIREQCYLLISGDRNLTQNVAAGNAQWLETNDELTKAVACRVGSFDGLIIANFHQDPIDITTQFLSGEQVSVNLSRLSTIVRRDIIEETTIDQSTSVPLYDKQFVTWGKVRAVRVFQNYPNPSNPGTWFPFQLSNDSNVTINIYDIRGNLVQTLQLGQRTAGSYVTKEEAAYWDGKDRNSEIVVSGVYFYNVKVGNFTTNIRKMLIVR